MNKEKSKPDYFARQLGGNERLTSLKDRLSDIDHKTRYRDASNEARRDRPGLRADIRALLDCQAVYALRDWSKSPGATVEVNLAGGLHMHVIFQRAKKGTKRKK